jgi:hypothetical protein
VNQAQAALRLQQSGSLSEEIEQARSQVEQRQQALNLLKAGSRPEDIDAARAQVEAARGALQTIQTQLNDPSFVTTEREKITEAAQAAFRSGIDTMRKRSIASIN